MKNKTCDDDDDDQINYILKQWLILYNISNQSKIVLFFNDLLD